MKYEALSPEQKRIKELEDYQKQVEEETEEQELNVDDI